MNGRERERRKVLTAAAAFACAGIARAQTPTNAAPTAPPPTLGTLLQTPPLSAEDLVTLDLGETTERRMLIPVTLDGRGPFPFIVDTGADHSVISSELATALALAPAGFVRVQGVAGSMVRPRAGVRRFEVGGRRIDGAAYPLLARHDLGALGLVGLDALRQQRVELDFLKNTLQVRRSHTRADQPGDIVVRAKSRYGQLMLIDSGVRRTPILVVLDSGAENTLGNGALRALLYNRRRAAAAVDPRRAIELTSVTGQTIMGELDEMPELTLGEVTLRHVPIVYSDLATFRLFGLIDQPALMLGMDTLRVFHRVSIDFARREIAFNLPPT